MPKDMATPEVSTQKQVQETIKIDVGSMEPVAVSEQINKAGKYAWKTIAIMAGRSYNGNIYSPEVLQAAVPLFEGTRCFSGHESIWYRNPSEGYLGYFTDVSYNSNTRNEQRPELLGGGVELTLNVIDEDFQFKLERLYEAGRLEQDFGLSIMAQVTGSWSEETDSFIIEEFLNVESVDAVFMPSAGGMFKGEQTEESQEPGETEEPVNEDYLEDVEPESNKDVVSGDTILDKEDKRVGTDDYTVIQRLADSILQLLKFGNGAPEHQMPQVATASTSESVSYTLPHNDRYNGTDIDLTVVETNSTDNVTISAVDKENENGIDTLEEDLEKNKELIAMTLEQLLALLKEHEGNIPADKLDGVSDELMAEALEQYNTVDEDAQGDEVVEEATEDEKPVTVQAVDYEAKMEEMEQRLLDSMAQAIEKLGGNLTDEIKEQREALATQKYNSQVRDIVNESGLPASAKSFIVEMFVNSNAPIADINRAIEAQRKILDTAPEHKGDLGMSKHITASPRFDAEKATTALEGMLGLAEVGHNDHMSLREWYLACTNDRAFRGVTDARHIAESGIQTSTITSIVKNALNKALLSEYEAIADQRWWEPIVSNVSEATLHDVTTVKTGGFGALDVVPERQAYEELDFTDLEETASFVKRGNYVGITLESFMKDDLSALRRIPRTMARSYNYTMSQIVSDVFMSNSGAGPTLAQTSAALFSTTHGNYVTTALSYAAMVAARAAMMKQTDPGSLQRLGLNPRYLLVPIDLMETAEQIRMSDRDPDSTAMDNSVNTLQGKFETIVVPDFTDATNWYLAAPPNRTEGIILHWFQGQRMPELFESGDERQGALFTNDEIRYKIRFWVARSVADFRPMYGAVVAG